MARTNQTSDPRLAAIFTAERINQASGGTVIAAWEVDQLPYEWQDAFTGLTVQLPQIKAGLARVEQVVQAWRQKAMLH